MNSGTGAIIIEGHIQGLSNTRSLGEAGIPVYIVDSSDCIARYSKYCKKYFRCQQYHKDEFADFLIDLSTKEKLRNWVLFPSNDHAVYTISKHKKRLEKHYNVITPGLGIIQSIYDKSKLLEIAQGAGIPIPNTCYLHTIDNKLPAGFKFPVLTKGHFGLDFYKTLGKKVFVAKNESQLKDQLKDIDSRYGINKTMTQEVIRTSATNKTISFAAFCINGEIKTYWMGIKVREHPIQFGTATFAKSMFQEQCLKHSQTLLKALDYSGVCEIEYLYEDSTQEYKLIEINARTWLWVGLAKTCGIDFALYIYNYFCTGDKVYPEDYLKNVYWINRLTDSVFSCKAILKGVLPFGAYLASLKEKKVPAIYASSDLMPAIISPFLIVLRGFRILANRFK
ncbi:MAG: hypothetical protein ABFS32_19745 [Bacteroidota bacterium]